VIDRTDLEQEFFEELVEGTMYDLVMARCKGLSEVTGRPGVDIHHILGRKKPRGFKVLPDILRECWPHPPMNMIMLTKAEHQAAEKYKKMMRPLLLGRLAYLYGGQEWGDMTYWERLHLPPFKEFLQ